MLNAYCFSNSYFIYEFIYFLLFFVSLCACVWRHHAKPELIFLFSHTLFIAIC